MGGGEKGDGLWVEGGRVMGCWLIGMFIREC